MGQRHQGVPDAGPDVERGRHEPAVVAGTARLAAGGREYERARQGRTSPGDLAVAIASMRTLNRAAAEVLVAAGIGGATDVTGFGLLGHARDMLSVAQLGLELQFASVPQLPRAAALAWPAL